jgi:outer membrane receptor for ferrienterochelin and colicins
VAVAGYAQLVPPSACFLAFISLLIASAQQASLRIEVRSGDAAVAGASVVVSGEQAHADERGIVELAVAAGAVEIVVVKEGFEPASLALTVAPGETRTVTVELASQTALEEHVTVSATRTGRGIDDEPIRVEVLDGEEIEEKLMMTPGDIVMMLNEMGGLRAQATSPSLGAASVRIQGMRGRYTRFLSDGLPLFGEQTGSFGIMQIPPIDLAQVEVIKGVASSLYGAGAMGGVVNLVSRRPAAQRERQLLFNRSSRGATDAAMWYAAPLSERWGLSLLGSANGQARADVDDDGWADLPKYARVIGRPRLYWDDHAGNSFYATGGVTIEDRIGGTLPGATLEASGEPYVEGLDTRRFDAAASYQRLTGSSIVLSLRASATHQRQEHQFGELLERDTHDTVFTELSLRRALGSHTLVGGVAIEHDRFRPLDVPQFAYTFTVPGLFVQDDLDVAQWLSVSAGARIDWHSEYGTFLSPRLSGLLRYGEWTSRLSYGIGFTGPTPLIEETEAAGLSRLIIPAPLIAEKGRSASLDITRAAGPLTATLTLFASTVRNPVEAEREDRFALVNRTEATDNTGLEALVISRIDALSIVGNYAWVRAREGGPDRPDVPLTPRHSVGIDTMWSWADGRDGRLGIEWFYTGEQRLEANPYRDRSRPYNVFGVLFERRVGRARLFINGENLTDVRQTRWDPIVRPERGVDGRWTVDAWAPLEGRTINGGVRWSF